jgi:hypothetical protein
MEINTVLVPASRMTSGFSAANSTRSLECYQIVLRSRVWVEKGVAGSQLCRDLQQDELTPGPRTWGYNFRAMVLVEVTKAAAKSRVFSHKVGICCYKGKGSSASRWV